MSSFTYVLNGASLISIGGFLTALPMLQDVASLRLVMAPKSIVAKEVINKLAPIPVHQMNMFSSLSALLGTPGQANYVIANLQINEVSHQQHGKGKCLKSYEASL